VVDVQLDAIVDGQRACTGHTCDHVAIAARCLRVPNEYPGHGGRRKIRFCVTAVHRKSDADRGCFIDLHDTTGTPSVHKALMISQQRSGINDAPAQAKADVGVAMGTGTDVAMNSAQVTLVKGDLRGIAQARVISDETIANMKQNLGFAFVYNALGVPLAAGVLFPFTGWLLSPMIAALAMSLSSASVIFNALRLRRTAPSK
jgi:hypothetical protein